MNSTEFEKEIQKLSKDFTVRENPNRPGLSNIFYKGKNYDLPVISTHLIKEEIDPGYRYEFPNGTQARMWAQGEILDRLRAFLEKGTEEYEDDDH